MVFQESNTVLDFVSVFQRAILLQCVKGKCLIPPKNHVLSLEEEHLEVMVLGGFGLSHWRPQKLPGKPRAASGLRLSVLSTTGNANATTARSAAGMIERKDVMGGS